MINQSRYSNLQTLLMMNEVVGLSPSSTIIIYDQSMEIKISN